MLSKKVVRTNNRKRLILPALLVVLAMGILIGYAAMGAAQTDRAATGAQEAHKQLYSCGMHPEIIREEPGNCPICGMQLTPVRSSGPSSAATPQGERKIKYWKSSMDPTYVSPEPGKDAMGMDLVPVYEDEIQEGAINIDPVTVQNMGVRTAMAEEKTLKRTVTTVGHVAYDESRLYTVGTKVGGWIEKLYVAKTGDPVRKGQALLEIYAPELVSTQQEYLSALENLERLKTSPYADARKGAEDLVASTRQRLRLWDISDDQIEAIEKTGETRRTMVLESPADGTVIEKNVVEGASVEAGSELFKVADLSRVWILAHVYDYELPFVAVGATASIDLPYLPGEKAAGRISYMYPYLDENTRDVTVRIELANPGLKLRPEMYANVTISQELEGARVAVPEEAVIRSGKREIVFVDLGDGRYSPREVTTGALAEGNLVEIKQGLLPHEMVVVSAQFMLDSESKTQEAIKKMLAQRTGTAPAAPKMEQMEHHGAAPQPPPAAHEPPKAPATTAAPGNLNLTPTKMAHSAGEVYVCPMEEHSDVMQVGPGKCTKCGMGLVPAPQTGRDVYSCPMEEHHYILSNRAATCPDCGMKLTPLE